MTTVVLTPAQQAELFKQDPDTKARGGFQRLLVTLQEKTGSDGRLTLSVSDLERIPKYAFDYGNGGWEDRLRAIFGSHLGPSLGR